MLAEIDDDPLINLRDFKEDRYRKLSQLIQYSTRIAELQEDVSKLEGLNSRRADLSRQITLLEESGYKEVLQNYNLRKSQGLQIEQWENKQFGLIEELASLIEKLEVEGLNLARLEGQESVEVEVELEATAGNVSESFSEVVKVLSEQYERLNEEKIKWFEAKSESAWEREAQGASSAYADLKERLDAENADNPELYAQLVEQRNRIDASLLRIKESVEELEAVMGRRALVVSTISENRQDLSSRRSNLLVNLFDDHPLINISLMKFGDSRVATQSLREVLQRADGFEEIEQLVDALYAGHVSPSVERIEELRSALRHAAERGELHNSFGNVRIKKRLCEHLAQRTAEDWARLDAWFPPDSLKIQIARDGAGHQYVDLNRASPGQVATAVLAFLLQYGDEPLILDQPEDDLDNQMVFRVIVSQLRRIKKKRQVIIITHNANLVVNGNADLIFPLDTSVGPTRLETRGTLQQKEVRDAVCGVMEGGRRALEQRFRRMISSID